MDLPSAQKPDSLRDLFQNSLHLQNDILIRHCEEERRSNLEIILRDWFLGLLASLPTKRQARNDGAIIFQFRTIVNWTRSGLTQQRCGGGIVRWKSRTIVGMPNLDLLPVYRKAGSFCINASPEYSGAKGQGRKTEILNLCHF
ncbi:hypothetical protein FHS59_003569 [Algoriphagus iocasae]|uniref:Uncharacterized protein n=1 Tax=Algoriphagus iocasae TaxID=1836499 RepID=A0A841MV14_9BACT|nr:hypothetical protein [Algoriphagus iocasae]